jgi:hypothetical protein
MVDEPKPEPRYKWKPIVATATKVGDVKGETVLKINVPIEEDAKIMVDAAKKIDRDGRDRDKKELEAKERDERDRDKKERDERDRDKKERDERDQREIMVTEENKKLKREKEELEKKLVDERDRDKKLVDERDRDKKLVDERDRDKKLEKKDTEAKSYSNKITTGTTSISTYGSAGFGIVDDSVKILDKNKKKGDRKMEDYEVEQKVNSLVEKRVRETLSQMDIQKTIKDIGMSSAQTEKKVIDIEESIGGINEKLKSLIEKEDIIEKNELNTQEGLSGKIEETKNEVDKYGKASVEKIDHIHQEVVDLKKKMPEKVLCTGEKGCNSEIEVGSSYCPNCGRGIDEYPEMPDWVPYSERKR